MFNLNGAQRTTVIGATTSEAFATTRFNSGLQCGHFFAHRLEKLDGVFHKCLVDHAQLHVRLIRKPRGQTATIKWFAHNWSHAQHNMQAKFTTQANERANIKGTGEIHATQARLMQTPRRAGSNGVETHLL